MLWLLFWQFLAISAVAFGGGVTVTLVERVAVREQGWVSDGEFATAFAFGQAAPGPAQVVATFIGYRAAGFAGACAATLGAFLIPWALGLALSGGARRLGDRPGLRGFMKGATAASIGLIAVTAIALLGGQGNRIGAFAIGMGAFGVAARTNVHPIVILIAGALVGAIVGLG